MRDADEGLTLCCLLWARANQSDGLHAYEDAVLALFADHGAIVLERVFADGANRQPVEVQLLWFPRQAAMDAYVADPRREALLAERDRVVERTELFPVRRALAATR